MICLQFIEEQEYFGKWKPYCSSTQNYLEQLTIGLNLWIEGNHRLVKWNIVMKLIINQNNVNLLGW